MNHLCRKFLTKLHCCAAMITQFLTDVDWGERDYLIIDTPPGTSDEHITVVEQLKKIRLDGAVVVTTPQVRLILLCVCSSCMLLLFLKRL